MESYQLTFNGHNAAGFLHAWGMPPGFIKLVDLPHVMGIVQRLLSRDEQLSQRRRRFFQHELLLYRVSPLRKNDAY